MLAQHLDQQTVYTLMAVLPLVLQVGCLAFAITADAFFNRRQKQAFLLILALGIALIAQNYTEMLLARSGQSDLLRTVVAICGYVLRPIILLLLYYLVEPKGNFWQGWVLVALNTVLYLSALFSPLVFSIVNNHYEGGSLSHTCLIVSLTELVGLVWLSVRKARMTRGKEILIPLAMVPIILISIWLDYRVSLAEQPVTFLTIAIVGCCTLYYLWPHLQAAQEQVRKEREQQRMELMLSQIKPHFIYNTLETIEALCLTDPQTAAKATSDFSQYLRSNLAGIGEEKTVPFERELAHTRQYLALEKMRFEDDLQVEYDIQVQDFFLPPLTLEPLVENAVRHGVRMRPDGRGTVKISTAERPDGYELRVQDDGPGFDPKELPKDGKPHIGIQNVRARLEACGGRLEIVSKPGAGTTAVIVIPREKEENDADLCNRRRTEAAAAFAHCDCSGGTGGRNP